MNKHITIVFLLAFACMCRSAHAQKVTDHIPQNMDDTITVVGLMTTDCINCYMPVYNWLREQEHNSTTTNLMFLIPETRNAELESFVTKNIPFYKNYFFLRDDKLYKAVVDGYRLSRPTYHLRYDYKHQKMLSVQSFNVLK
ncbi:hypothetical protein ACTHGU_13560 [Chitinophagaceae bacterium MMS25-I14]